ncbi:MAG: aminopeptidase [Bacteroidetes bacterium]|nr:MAG: aminopeptidase [Bacteroidota bacterium]
MKPRIVIFLFGFFSHSVFGQDISQWFNEKKVTQIESTLASDSMEGRKAGTRGIEKATEFISSQFKSAGLQTWDKSNSYQQKFAFITIDRQTKEGSMDGLPIKPQNLVVFSAKENLEINDQSGYKSIQFKKGDNFRANAIKWTQSDENLIVWVDSSFAPLLASLEAYSRNQLQKDRNILFVLSNRIPDHFNFRIQQQITVKPLANVIGILPGKTKKNEYVIFSAHYDHLGIGTPNALHDSIFNGANDDASGTTAVIMLANYFAKRNDNARTLIFVAFTAEEMGGYGSAYFSTHFNPDSVIAMFNIEMIGTESKWGSHSAYVTGYDKSDMPKILEKNLQGTEFKFYPDPYAAENLFYRSDNATLAKLGVPAHTISTSKMDDEKFYQTVGDEVQTLNMTNMTEIIRAIALSARSIVSGEDTPTRIEKIGQ